MPSPVKQIKLFFRGLFWRYIGNRATQIVLLWRLQYFGKNNFLKKKKKVNASSFKFIDRSKYLINIHQLVLEYKQISEETVFLFPFPNLPH